MKKNILFSLLLPLFVALPALAQSNKDLLEGTVQSISSEKLELKTEDGAVTVALAKETKVQMGMDGNHPAAKEDIRAKDFLMINGHKTANGVFVAEELMIHRKPEPLCNAKSGSSKCEAGENEGMKIDHSATGGMH